MNASYERAISSKLGLLYLIIIGCTIAILQMIQLRMVDLSRSEKSQIVYDYGLNEIQLPRNTGSKNLGLRGRRNVIAMLVKTVNPMVIARQIRTIDVYLHDGNKTDFVVFHEDFPFSDVMLRIRRSTPRNVEFVNVDNVLRRPSRCKNVHPYKTDPFWSKGGKWAYQSMIRFWFSDIYLLPVMDDVDYLMRIDDDSVISEVMPNLFSQIKLRQGVYMANTIQVEQAGLLPGTDLLEDMAKKYVESTAIQVRDKLAWENAFPQDSVRMYYNNFEVSSVPFFRRMEVLKWTNAVLDSGGIFLYRWGDAPLRYLTLALFASPTEVLHRGVDFNISYCHPIGHMCELPESKLVYQGPPELQFGSL